MYRVELKGSRIDPVYKANLWFLMYRVELKVQKRALFLTLGLVPNVPCGVERLLQSSLRIGLLRNVLFLMYRVELKAFIVMQPTSLLSASFLMYRAELKATILPASLPSVILFLMYRVELKDDLLECKLENFLQFLMYRVELKGFWRNLGRGQYKSS